MYYNLIIAVVVSLFINVYVVVWCFYLRAENIKCWKYCNHNWKDIVELQREIKALQIKVKNLIWMLTLKNKN